MGAIQELYQTPAIQESQQQAQTSATQAAAYQSAAALLPQKLKQAINEKLDYNKDIIEAKNKAAAEYFQAPSAAREKYQNIFNPFQREALVAEERAQAYLPYANLVDIQGQRTGSIQDIIGSATGLFQSDVLAKQAAADIDRLNYQDKLGLAGLLAEALETETRLDFSQQELDLAKQREGRLAGEQETSTSEEEKEKQITIEGYAQALADGDITEADVINKVPEYYTEILRKREEIIDKALEEAGETEEDTLSPKVGETISGLKEIYSGYKEWKKKFPYLNL